MGEMAGALQEGKPPVGIVSKGSMGLEETVDMEGWYGDQDKHGGNSGAEASRWERVSGKTGEAGWAWSAENFK